MAETRIEKRDHATQVLSVDQIAEELYPVL